MRDFNNQEIYVCPNQVRHPDANYLLCSALMKPNKQYKVPSDFATAMCAHQYMCRITNRWENTYGREAKECPLLHKL